MIDHAFDYDAATLEICRCLNRVAHLVGVIEQQHRTVGAMPSVRWTKDEIAALSKLADTAHVKRACYAGQRSTDG